MNDAYRPAANAGPESAQWLRLALGLDEGSSPFPWQEELLRWFQEGRIPRALDLPTGLGKTSVMGIWLVARACGANLPRRLVYVVDRRAVVDQATDVARRLREVVDGDPDLKRALGLAPEARLPISTLRGQFADNREWLADPASPAIVVGTVDMIGSRLLFEGYSVSRRMRPYHAGLLGVDSLIVLDESHLVPPFEALVATLANDTEQLGGRDEEARTVVPPVRMLSLSATGRHTPDTFTLTAEDEENYIVRRRLDAAKRLVIREPVGPRDDGHVTALAREAWALSESSTRPIRCIVFCDRRRDAHRVREELEAMAKRAAVEIDTELLVGGRRVHEREAAAAWLKERGFLAGHGAVPSRPAFLAATSAGEVGVDLDADHAVCDLVEWERMVQRFGRVNRRGDGDATVVVVPRGPDEATAKALAKADKARAKADKARQEADEGDDDAVGALKPEEQALLRRHERREASLRLVAELRAGDVLDARPAAIMALKARARVEPDVAQRIARASSPPPLRPQLTRPLVEAWAMTSLRDHAGRPEVQPWIRGWVDDAPQTAIVWRRHLPVGEGGAALRDADVAAFFDAAPVHLVEQLEVETAFAVQWLAKRVDALVRRAKRGATASSTAAPEQDGEGGTAPERSELTPADVIGFILPPGGAPIALRGDALADRDARGEYEKQMRGATLVVDCRVGGLRGGLLDDAHDDASDVGDTPGVLPIRVRRERAGVTAPSDPQWREELRLAVEVDAEGEPQAWLIVESDRALDAITEEGRSTTSRAQLLDEHQQWVEERARELGDRLGLPPKYIDVLALAGRLHDEGKRAARWQRAFGAPPGGPWGKTTSRPNQTILDGYRHELGSLLYAMRDPRVTALDEPLRDLCLHLIAAHHGFARPVIAIDGCDDAPPSALVGRAREIALRFSRLQRRWGPWGLAWWEALLRAADQRASRDNDERSTRHG